MARQVEWEYYCSRDRHYQQEPRDQLILTYNGSGPEYQIFDYFPAWHFDHTHYILDNHGYDALTEFLEGRETFPDYYEPEQDPPGASQTTPSPSREG